MQQRTLRLSILFMFLIMFVSCLGASLLFTALTLRNEGFLDYDPNPIFRTQTAIMLMLANSTMAGILARTWKQRPASQVWYLFLFVMTLSFMLSVYVFVQVYARYA